MKLQLDEDFNIIEPEDIERKSLRKKEILGQLSELGSRKSWLLEEVGELECEMDELEVEYKNL